MNGLIESAFRVPDFLAQVVKNLFVCLNGTANSDDFPDRVILIFVKLLRFPVKTCSMKCVRLSKQ